MKFHPRIIWKWLSIHICDLFIVCAKAEEALERGGFHIYSVLGMSLRFLDT